LDLSHTFSISTTIGGSVVNLEDTAPAKFDHWIFEYELILTNPNGATHQNCQKCQRSQSVLQIWCTLQSLRVSKPRDHQSTSLCSNASGYLGAVDGEAKCPTWNLSCCDRYRLRVSDSWL